MVDAVTSKSRKDSYLGEEWSADSAEIKCQTTEKQKNPTRLDRIMLILIQKLKRQKNRV